MDNNIVSFRDLKIWQKGMELARDVYKITSKLPKDELFGLTSQLRRAAISVPSNIAEGRCRGTRKDFCQFLIESLFSINVHQLIENIHEEQKMTSAMINRLKAKS